MNREEKVAVFNCIMGQPISDNPGDVPLKLRQLGIQLIFEELKELAVASGCEATFVKACDKAIIDTLDNVGMLGLVAEDKDSAEQTFKGVLAEAGVEDHDYIDEVEQADGLGDLQYTVSWCVNVFGFSKNFAAIFNEVCRSNNSKACLTEAEAIITLSKYNDEEPENGTHYIDKVEFAGISYFIVKNKNGKVRKSVNYSPAELSQFLLKTK